MGTPETLTDLQAAWNAGRGEPWDATVEYRPGETVTSNNGLSGWVAVAVSLGVEPARDSNVWAMVWASSGPGHLGASG
jgi:hypothetical protein